MRIQLQDILNKQFGDPEADALFLTQQSLCFLPGLVVLWPRSIEKTEMKLSSSEAKNNAV